MATDSSFKTVGAGAGFTAGFATAAWVTGTVAAEAAGAGFGAGTIEAGLVYAVVEVGFMDEGIT